MPVTFMGQPVYQDCGGHPMVSLGEALRGQGFTSGTFLGTVSVFGLKEKLVVS
jgi:hypothetical protein